MKTWEEGKDFLTELKADKDVTAKLKPAELEAMFDLGYHFKHVDTIFKRVFGKPSRRTGFRTAPIPSRSSERTPQLDR